MTPINETAKRPQNTTTSLEDAHRAASSAGESTLDAIAGTIRDTGREWSEDVARSARAFREELGEMVESYEDEFDNLMALPGERLDDLEVYQSEVGELEIALSAKTGVGGGGKAKFDYEIARTASDRYEATFRGNVGGHLGLGEEIADEGISVDVNGEGYAELAVVATGEQGADDLARALGNPMSFMRIVDASPHLELKAATFSNGGGVSAAGAGAGVSVNTETFRGVERYDGELHAIHGQRARVTAGIDTPSVTFEDGATATREMQRACTAALRAAGLPPQLVPEEAFAEMAELNGNMVGIKAELSGSVEYSRGYSSEAPSAVKVAVEGTFGERKLTVDASATFDPATRQGQTIAKHLENGDLQAAERSGLRLEWKMSKTSFSGTVADLPVVSKRSGVETVQTLSRSLPVN